LSRVAAIDCGTNSIRLLIADITDGNFKEVVRTMEIVRLGQGVDQNKSFHPDAITRTLSAVEKFAQLIASKGVEKIRFCATSATRDASNRELFTNGVKKIFKEYNWDKSYFSTYGINEIFEIKDDEYFAKALNKLSMRVKNGDFKLTENSTSTMGLDLRETTTPQKALSYIQILMIGEKK